MKRIRNVLICFVLFAYALSVPALSQQFKFRQLTFEDGLTDQFIYKIDQSSQGYLLICTSTGLSEYDGDQVTKVEVPEWLPNTFITSITQVNGTSWLGHNDGTVSFLRRHKFVKAFIDSSFQSRIEALVYDSASKTLWALSQSLGIKVFSTDKKKLLKKHELSSDYIYHDIAIAKNGDVLLATDMGLIRYSISKGRLVDERIILEDEVKSIIRYKDGYLLVGANAVWVLSSNNSIVDLETGLSEDTEINSGYIDGEKNLWLTTNDGLYRCTIVDGRLKILVHFNQENGLNSIGISDVYQDSERNIWVGTKGDGLLLLVDDFFTFYHEERFEENDVTAMFLEDSIHWYGIDGMLVRKKINGTDDDIIYTSENGLPTDHIRSICRDNKGTLWIGYENSGLFYSNGSNFKQLELTGDRLSNSIYKILDLNDSLGIGTENGLYIVHYRNGNKLSHYSTRNGIRHNKIYDLNKDSKGNIWIGSRSNYISYLTREGIKEIEVPTGGILIDVISVLKKDSILWLGTINDGIIYYSNGEFRHYSLRDGMLSNYCTAIIHDDQNRLWIGHRNGISRLNLNTEKIETFGRKYGITGGVNRHGFAFDSEKNIWIDTNVGAIKYNPKKEPNQKLAPLLDLVGLTIDDIEYQNDDRIDLSFGDHKIEFRFKGISFKHSDELVYMYRLLGYDNSWTIYDSEDPVIAYNKLPAGKYEFQVKVCLGETHCSEIKTYPQIVIDAPFWTKWWFILSCIVGAVSIILIIIFLRVRQLKRIQNYLQHNLDIKTKEVVDKNKLLERKNKDITDSIKYAKRIQSAMLPEEVLLSTVFEGSFIFYKPRDIVSGDFYWYEQFGDVMYVVCADCTGHGVPGSLMSMIGSVTIGNILTKKSDLSPSELLYRLDFQIKDILKQKSDDPYGKIQDGMDIVVCAINVKTLETRISSAKRHFFVKLSGKLKMFKPSRHSIGGRETDKVFDEIKLDLNKGDILYLFSDGYTDQIGGERGRKMMIPGLLTLLENIKNEPLDVQETAVDKHFHNWLGQEYQLDDVLFMGVSV